MKGGRGMKEQKTYYLGQLVILVGNIILLIVIMFPWKEGATQNTVKACCITSVVSIMVLTLVNYVLIERKRVNNAEMKLTEIKSLE
jgi:riboflavin transporter FmnP